MATPCSLSEGKTDLSYLLLELVFKYLVFLHLVIIKLNQNVVLISLVFSN